MIGRKCASERGPHRASIAEPERLAARLMQPFAHSSVRYLLVGFSNTAVGFAVIWIALRCFGLGNVGANATGYSVAFLWSFALNRKWTFYHKGAVGAALFRYLLATAAAYGMNLLVVILAERRLSPGSLFIQIGGMLTYTAVAYIGARYFVFPARSAPSWRLKS
jgi:putative flippase GtrA